jgi:hypothetical protein
MDWPRYFFRINDDDRAMLALVVDSVKYLVGVVYLVCFACSFCRLGVHLYQSWRLHAQSGTEYEGEWHRQMFHGRGRLRRWAPNSAAAAAHSKHKVMTYIGEFADNMLHGRGRLALPDGTVIFGSFERTTVGEAWEGRPKGRLVTVESSEGRMQCATVLAAGNTAPAAGDAAPGAGDAAPRSDSSAAAVEHLPRAYCIFPHGRPAGVWGRRG